VVLAGGLALLLCVVVLRAETTRLHNEIAQCELRTERARQRLREVELELERLRNPILLRNRVRDALEQYLDTGVEPDAGGTPRRP
jgi:hypothetical protein